MANSPSSAPARADDSMEPALLAAKERLTAKGLFGHPDDSISLRLSDQPLVLWGDGQSAQTISLDSPAAGGGTFPVHAAVYRARSDVGAVIVARTPWGNRLARLRVVMPALFDEQIRQLGQAVTPWARASRALARGDNAFTHGEAILCLGTTSDRAVFNLELVEKCAQSFVLAHLTGVPIRRVPRWVQWIARGRLKKDQRRAAAAFARGEYPVLATGY